MDAPELCCLKPFKFNLLTRLMSTPTSKIHTVTEPNEELLEAQARVCTGPNQSRPLGLKPGDPDPQRIYGIVLDSLSGSLTGPATRAQIGAFLCAMTLRRAYPPKTTWSEAETRAFEDHRSRLLSSDPAIRFLIDPCTPLEILQGAEDRALLANLGHILAGEHLSYRATREVLASVLSPRGDEALKAAVLIGQRMNHENYDEFRAYLDAVYAPEDILSVSTSSLTTIGEPYNGSARYFKPTCFLAATRAALGRPTLLHGVDSAPPKLGITDEQILRALGADTQIPLDRAAELLSLPEICFAFVSQSVFSPQTYAMLDLRHQIKKRPTWAASEKAQMLIRSTGRNDMVVGYFHPGYEDKQLRAMRKRGLDAGIVIKGEEGTSQVSLRVRAPSEARKKTLNNVEGFRDGVSFALDIDPADLGFNYEQNPRLPEISAEAFAEAGRSALLGEPGHVLDRIVLNTGTIDWLLGYESNHIEAISKARDAIESGRALAHLDAYIETSHEASS